jgi:hypothetical protein
MSRYTKAITIQPNPNRPNHTHRCSNCLNLIRCCKKRCIEPQQISRCKYCPQVAASEPK